MENTFKEASKAYELREFKKAFELFMTLASMGDPDAMSMIALMYDQGEGVACDFESSIAWGIKAGEAGSTSALINLGISYRSRGNLKTAKFWFERALSAGDAEAALELAKICMVDGFDTESAKKYLQIVLAEDRVCEASKEEAENLLNGMQMPQGSEPE